MDIKNRSKSIFSCNTTTYLFFNFVFFIAIITGCASGKKPVTEILTLPVTQKDIQPLKELPAQRIESELRVKEEGKPEKLFSLAIQEADVRDVVLSFSKETELSVLIDPEVKGIVPVIDLKKVTFQDALDYILKPMGFDYSIEGKFLKVFKPKMETKVFSLNYIAVSREGDRTITASARGGEGGQSGASEGGGGGTGGMSVVNENRINIANSANPWFDIRKGLETIIFGKILETGTSTTGKETLQATSLGDESGRRLIINPFAGLVYVTDTVSKLNEIAEFLESIEGSIQRQVLIEAKILEVSLSDSYQLGVNWESVFKAGSLKGTLPEKLKLNNTGLSQQIGTPLLQPLNPALGVFQFAIANDDISFILDALARQGSLNVLSTPKVSTLNNQKAIIRVVREEAFFTLRTTQTVTSGISQITENVETTTVPIGLVLDIIPQISKNGEITLSINPSVSELVEIRSFTSPSGDSSATQPVIDRRDLDTVAKVKDGQSIVIAGIINNRKQREVRGVPFLKDIPWLGKLFAREEESVQKTELVIMISPKIIMGKDIDEIAKVHNKRFKDIQGRLSE